MNVFCLFRYKREMNDRQEDCEICYLLKIAYLWYAFLIQMFCQIKQVSAFIKSLIKT